MSSSSDMCIGTPVTLVITTKHGQVYRMPACDLDELRSSAVKNQLGPSCTNFQVINMHGAFLQVPFRVIHAVSVCDANGTVETLVEYPVRQHGSG